MINPNATSSHKGIVTLIDRREDGTIRNLEVLFDSGYTLESVYSLNHKTILVNERVSVTVGFRIVSDRYVIESIRRVPRKIID